MRLKRATSLVLLCEKDGFVIFNYLAKKSFSCSSAALTLLAAMEDWQDPEQCFSRFPESDARDLAQNLGQLVELGALVAEGTEAADLDERYRSRWEWGPAVGLYHFGIKNERFADEEETRRLLERRLATREQPALVESNERFATVRLLQRPVLDGPLAVMVARRSERWLVRKPVPEAALAACLYAGLGITGFIEDEILGRLPLKMAPSGGARNPYEGYVYVTNVDGVTPGVYHYSGAEHSLGLIHEMPLPRASHLLSEQQWIDDAAAVLFLVAHFERTTWKYVHPNSYRVVLIEAGHIVQNVSLVASAHGLTTTPTCAIQDELVEAVFDLDPITQAVVYAVAIGVAAGERRRFHPGDHPAEAGKG